jgi:alcohol dehydrogenase (cytochrome c)
MKKRHSTGAMFAAVITLSGSHALAYGGAEPPRDAAGSGVTTSVKPIENFVPVTDALLRNPDPNDWLMMRGNYEGYGHSTLNEINKSNVKQLQLVWSRGMEPGVNQATPLIYKGVMYLGNPGDVIQAIDATTGNLLWQHRRKLPSIQDLHGTWGQRMRSVFLYEDKLYFVSWDNFVVALDARTGKALWETNRGGDLYATNTNGPIVVDGVVIAGGNCQIAPFPCVVTGHDAQTGVELWRNSVVPRPGEPGDETWGGVPYEKRWITGVWGAITYDPQTNLVHYGSSGIGPASEVQRNQIGATLAGTNTRFAVDPRTGKVAWSHQVLPRDNWDQECTFEMLPITTPVRPDAKTEGMMAVNSSAATGSRRTLTGVPCKIGMMWSFDAKTGEFLWTKETAFQNLVEGVNSAGLVKVREDQTLQDLTKPYHHCPAYPGGRNWPFSAYSPRMNTLFIQIQNVCATTTARTDREPQPAFTYNTGRVFLKAPGKDNVGRIDAVSVETGRTLWTWETPVTNYSPILSTDGGLLFNGGMDRMLRAHDQDTGEVLWETRLPSQVFGATVTYSVGGRQYLAVASGGGYNGGPLSLTPEADGISGSNAIFVFALPER